MRSKLLALLTVASLTAVAANAGVVLNEVLGSTTSTDDEFIELYNTGVAAVDISGWKIELWDSDTGASYGGADGGSPFTIPGGTFLAAGDYLLLANNTYGSHYPLYPRDLALPENSIENSSYTIILTDAATTPVDSFFVTDGGVGDSANRAGAAFVPTATIGPDGANLPAGFYRSGDGASTYAFLEFSPQPAPSATPGFANLPEPSALALLGMGALAMFRRR